MVDHAPHLMWHENISKPGIPTGTANFANLNRAGREFESFGSPGLINAVRWTDWRDKSAEKNVTVQDDAHQPRRAHSNASSTACWISSNERPWFFSFALAASASKMRARTASSTKRDSSPLR